jgi:hypothetical protein
LQKQAASLAHSLQKQDARLQIRCKSNQAACRFVAEASSTEKISLAARGPSAVPLQIIVSALLLLLCCSLQSAGSV